MKKPNRKSLSNAEYIQLHYLYHQLFSKEVEHHYNYHYGFNLKYLIQVWILAN